MGIVIWLFKTECIPNTVIRAKSHRTIADVECSTAGRITRSNNKCLRSRLAYQAAEDLEQAHYAALNRGLRLAW